MLKKSIKRKRGMIFAEERKEIIYNGEGRYTKSSGRSSAKASMYT